MPLVLVVASVMALDQITKWWATERLSGGRQIDLVFGAKFNLVFNDGAAFSTGGGLGPLFAIAAVLVSGWLVWYATQLRQRALTVLFAMIAGGALGNVVDRVFRDGDGFLRGRVVDFVDVGWWPVFNVADAAIVVGVIVLLFTMPRSHG